MLARAPRARAGRSASDGRHSSAAHPAISAASSTQLTTSSAPTVSGWCRSGPNGSPAVRDATYTARTMAFPPIPAHSHGRDGRHSSTAGQISCAQESTRKNTPYSVYSAKCSKTTAKWMAAAPTDSAARAPSRYGRMVAGQARTSVSARTGVLMTAMLGAQRPARVGRKAELT